ncbi:MAG: hypothetical protein H7245_19395 [Candidatus Saccharibacteria bacterium]|nr:hypothetical protein [Pseudorhodobacter sp.]
MLRGGANTDSLIGNEGANQLLGGAGNDICHMHHQYAGHQRRDSMYGGVALHGGLRSGCGNRRA